MTPHVALVEMARVVAAITPNVMTLAVHSAIQPSSHVGVAVGKDPLVLRELVCRDAPSVVQLTWSGRSLVYARVSLRDHVLDVCVVILPIHMLVRVARWNLHRPSAFPRLAQRQPHSLEAIGPSGHQRHLGVGGA